MVKNLSDICLRNLSTESLDMECVNGNNIQKAFDEKKFKDLEYLEDVNVTIEKRFPELFINNGNSNKKRFISNNEIVSQKENVDSVFIHTPSTKLINDKRSELIKEKTALSLNEQMKVSNDIHQKNNYANIALNDLNSTNEKNNLYINKNDILKNPSEITIKTPIGEVQLNTIPKMFSSVAEVNNKNSGEKQSLLNQSMKSFYTQKISVDKNDAKEVKLNYPFQSWSGEHSVKVSLPMVMHGQGNIILQPSDTFTSDAISRQLDGLVDLQPELLRPHKDRDQRHGQHHYDIEQQDDDA